ncbi:GNAT family N-acetyltransferase [Streptomyces purpureus]|uniref:GNAT family N-acetyltransferase n=1 Tax=Streptomyces purpureus TaxID=1951 RepID=UPI0037B91F8E
MSAVADEYLRPARPDDLPALLALRAEATRWLRDRGSDQWSDARTGPVALEKWRRVVEQGNTWVVVDSVGGDALATVSRGSADVDFWTADDRPESAFYLDKLIVARRAAGRRLGERVVDWACGVAEREGRAWVRVDVWRTNPRLHAYYERLGFTHVRTCVHPGRRSGWLAQRAAATRTVPDAPLTARGGV